MYSPFLGYYNINYTKREKIVDKNPKRVYTQYKLHEKSNFVFEAYTIKKGANYGLHTRRTRNAYPL